MRSLIILPFAFFLLSGSQPPVGCRVTAREAPFIASRTMTPAVSPPTTVHIEVCIALEEVLGYENRIPYQSGVGFFDGIATTVEVAFDRRFSQPLIVPARIATPDQVLTGVAYDGVTDFGGTSGTTAHLPQQVLVVADLQVSDPSYFMSPWLVYIRATPDSAIFHAHGTGPLSAQRDTMVALGVGATYTP